MEVVQSILGNSKVRFLGWTIAGLYGLGKYAQYKWSSMLSEKGRELQTRQDLKNRFEYNLKDCEFVVQSLLPGLRDSLFQELNVELLLADLKQRQADKNSILEESKQQKRLMWNSLKLKSFARLIASLYLVNLLTLFTTVQISLLGRMVYLDSVKALLKAKPVDQGDELAELNQTPQPNAERSISENTERQYLTLSWYILNVGWKDLVSRIEKCVERVLDDTPLTYIVTYNGLLELLSNIRKEVDYDGDRLFKFDKYLLSPEGKETTIFAQGGLNARNIEPELQKLLMETRDFIECRDFGHVLTSCLDDSFDVLAKSFKPSFFDNFIAVSKPKFSLVEGDETPEEHISDGEGVSKSMPLAGVLPLVTRTSLQISTSVPNSYLEVISSNPDLKTFCSIIYGGWE